MSATTTDESCNACDEPIEGDCIVDEDAVRGDRLLCLTCADRLGYEIH